MSDGTNQVDDTHQVADQHKHWTSHAAKLLGTSESVVLVLIGGSRGRDLRDGWSGLAP